MPSLTNGQLSVAISAALALVAVLAVIIAESRRRSAAADQARRVVIRVDLDAREIHVRNQSEQPIRELELVDVAHAGDEAALGRWLVEAEASARRETHPVLEAHGDKTFLPLLLVEDGQLSGVRDLEVVIRFSDANGQRWERVNGGEPTLC